MYVFINKLYIIYFLNNTQRDGQIMKLSLHYMCNEHIYQITKVLFSEVK